MALYEMTLRNKKTQERRAKVAKIWDAGWGETKEQFYIKVSRRLRCSPNTVFNDLRAIQEQRRREAELQERLQAEGY